MTDQPPPGNSFRAAILRGEKPTLLVEEKQSRQEPGNDALDGAMVARSELRTSDHRDQDRHRLASESATARYEGEEHCVEIVNLSGGGAMIEASFSPRLWELVELKLGDSPAIEAAVRWVKGGRIGLEFAHETRIHCDPEARAALLLEVIQRSFPDSAIEIELPNGPEEPKLHEQEEAELGKRSDTRHPLIWSGQILFAFESNPVRLRNISAGGALVDVAIPYPVGAEVMLDLGDAGQFDAVVTWAQGDQAGIRFKEPFDLDCLAKLKPDLTPYRWERPTFLDPADGDSSPWDEQWSRKSIAELRRDLEGYLKH